MMPTAVVCVREQVTVFWLADVISVSVYLVQASMYVVSLSLITLSLSDGHSLRTF